VMMTEVASPELAAVLIAEGLQAEDAEQQPRITGENPTPQSDVQAPPQAGSPQESAEESAAPGLLPEQIARIEQLERARRQEQSRADVAVNEATAVRSFATQAERDVARLTAERDAYLRLIEQEQVTLTPEQRRLIELEAKDAAAALQSKVPAGRAPAPPLTKEQIEAGREADRQVLLGIGRELGVDLSKIPNLGLDLVVGGDTAGFLRHFASLVVAPYKAAMTAQQTPAQRRIAENRVPRQNGNAGSQDWRNAPIETQDPYELIKAGLDEADRRR
jgi:hypothetical protein